MRTLGFPRKILFIFSALLVLSIGFFVSADSDFGKRQSIFSDADQDGLSDDEERVFGTDPFNKDTDGDGYGDGVEVESGYDPLKPAPGDKLVASDDGLGKGGYDDSADTENLTTDASNEVVDLLSNVSKDDPSVSMDDLNASIEKLLKQSSVDVVIPNVDINTIKTKSVKCKSSESTEKCDAKKREATVEYLTVLSYLFANNSPIPLKTSADLESISNSFLNDATLALSTGNLSLLQDMSTRADTFLAAIKDVEVPSNMLEVHVKALKMGLFAQNLGKEFEKKSDDPIAQIALLSQMQGMMTVASDLLNEVTDQLGKLGIESIPVDL